MIYFMKCTRDFYSWKLTLELGLVQFRVFERCLIHGQLPLHPHRCRSLFGFKRWNLSWKIFNHFFSSLMWVSLMRVCVGNDPQLLPHPILAQRSQNYKVQEIWSFLWWLRLITYICHLELCWFPKIISCRVTSTDYILKVSNPSRVLWDILLIKQS